MGAGSRAAFRVAAVAKRALAPRQALPTLPRVAAAFSSAASQGLKATTCCDAPYFPSQAQLSAIQQFVATGSVPERLRLELSLDKHATDKHLSFPNLKQLLAMNHYVKTGDADGEGLFLALQALKHKKGYEALYLHDVAPFSALKFIAAHTPSVDAFIQHPLLSAFYETVTGLSRISWMDTPTRILYERADMRKITASHESLGRLIAIRTMYTAYNDLVRLRTEQAEDRTDEFRLTVGTADYKPDSPALGEAETALAAAEKVLKPALVAAIDNFYKILRSSEVAKSRDSEGVMSPRL